MGVDYTAYVGPYIQVHNPPRPSFEEYHTCTTANCSNQNKPMSSKFCPVCGGAVTLQSRPCQSPVQLDVFSEFNERLCEALSEYKPKDSKNEIFLIGNKQGIPGRSFDPIETCSAVDMTGFNITQETMLFRDMLTAELARLKEIFGEDAVQVKWGILCWAW
jgi:hypothetical protein